MGGLVGTYVANCSYMLSYSPFAIFVTWKYWRSGLGLTKRYLTDRTLEHDQQGRPRSRCRSIERCTYATRSMTIRFILSFSSVHRRL